MLVELELLPWRDLGVSKYQLLGRSFSREGSGAIDAGRLEHLRALVSLERGAPACED